MNEKASGEHMISANGEMFHAETGSVLAGPLHVEATAADLGTNYLPAD